MGNLEFALILIVIGVIVVLLILIIITQGLTIFINKYIPEKSTVVSKKEKNVQQNVVNPTIAEVISQAVDIITNDKGKVIGIEKIK